MRGNTYRKSTPVLVLAGLLLLALTTSVLADPEKAKENYNTALKSQQEGDIDAAVIAYKAAIAEDAEYVDAYTNLGAIYFEKKEYDNAINTFRTATEKAPANAAAWANLGRVYYAKGQYKPAIEAFTKTIGLDAGDTSLLKDLGKAYYKDGNYKDAVATLGQAHAAAIGDKWTYYYVGRSNQKLGKDVDAIAAFKMAAELDAKFYNAHYSLGSIYLAQEKYKSASRSFRAAMTAKPNKFKAVYNYAVAVESSDPENYDQSINVWGEFIKVAKKNPKAKDEVAQAEGHLKDLREAKEQSELQ